MIVVEMQLCSAISSSRDRQLCKVKIVNDGTSTKASRGNYDVTLYGCDGRRIRTARVENYPRNAKPAWRLLQAAMEAL